MRFGDKKGPSTFPRPWNVRKEQGVFSQGGHEIQKMITVHELFSLNTDIAWQRIFTVADPCSVRFLLSPARGCALANFGEPSELSSHKKSGIEQIGIDKAWFVWGEPAELNAHARLRDASL